MRCWAEINLENLRKNVIELEKITAKKNMMKGEKAIAYGHGMVKRFEEHGKENRNNEPADRS